MVGRCLASMEKQVRSESVNSTKEVDTTRCEEGGMMTDKVTREGGELFGVEEKGEGDNPKGAGEGYCIPEAKKPDEGKMQE
jgi:hypothetical protein